MAVERGRQLRRGRPRGKGYLLEESRGHDGPAKTYKRKTQRDQNRRSKFSHAYREGFPKHFSLQRNRTSPCRQPLFHAARRPTGAALLLRRLFHQHIAQVVAAIIACRTVTHLIPMVCSCLYVKRAGLHAIWRGLILVRICL
jgi:hypothetical protein